MTVYIKTLVEGYILTSAYIKTSVEGYVLTSAHIKTLVEGYVLMSAYIKTLVKGYALTEAYIKTLVKGYILMRAYIKTLVESYVLMSAYIKTLVRSNVLMSAYIKTLVESYVLKNAHIKTLVERLNTFFKTQKYDIMIPDEKMLFGNLFDDRKIISERLAAFAQDTINRLVAANETNEYTTLIESLRSALTSLRTELGDIATTPSQQKGATLTLNQLMAAFKNTMSEKKGAIADKLGGFTAPAFIEFYPKE
jgi:hypothetical protein